jgi:hypothetical protein
MVRTTRGVDTVAAVEAAAAAVPAKAAAKAEGKRAAAAEASNAPPAKVAKSTTAKQVVGSLDGSIADGDGDHDSLPLSLALAVAGTSAPDAGAMILAGGDAGALVPVTKGGKEAKGGRASRMFL